MNFTFYHEWWPYLAGNAQCAKVNDRKNKLKEPDSVRAAKKGHW